jgi:hypothetical protein
MRIGVVLLVGLCACADDADMGPDAAPDGAPADMAPSDPTASDLLQAVADCTSVIGGPYMDGPGQPNNVDICGFAGAVAWTSDLDVDCDGKMSAECNLQTDPAYQDQTAASDSHGDPLDAATLPYVVFPGASTRWDYRTAGIGMRTVVAVIYADQVVYGVAGDVGPTAYIGEASYAMADALGIDPDPSTGGTSSRVTYIAFTGMESRVSVIEDHAEATALGVARAKLLLGQ